MLVKLCRGLYYSKKDYKVGMTVCKRKTYEITKRLIDIIFSLVMIIVTAPAILITSIAIRVIDGGPVLYKANRVGKGFEEFVMLKFRTMKINNEKTKHITLKNDARIYPLGRFLRKTKIDELPQLYNVLTGRMSVVGPRPEDVSIAKKIYVGKYKGICDVKPGLTSPASLFDYTHGENYESHEKYIKEFLPKKLDIELYYVENKNICYDIKITLRTALIIVQIMFGKNEFRYPKEYDAVRELRVRDKDGKQYFNTGI